LDIYLFQNSSDGCNLGYSYSYSCGCSTLSRSADDTDGWGPEIATIGNRNSCGPTLYELGVKVYYTDGIPAFNVTVQVSSSNGLVARATIASNQILAISDGTWRPFRVNPNGSVVMA
jgi:hypothetical protein